MSRLRSQFLLLPVLALALILGLSAASPRAAFAAASPIVGTGSCGPFAVPNTYCSFANNGSAVDIVIGQDSCTAVDSCIGLGDGTTIGDYSCTASNACYEAGAALGDSSIGDYSCTAIYACYKAGFNGYSSIGDYSCTVDYACNLTGSEDEGGSYVGYSSIGDHSCTAIYACDRAGEHRGVSIIGDYSCTGESACYRAGAALGNSIIGDHSCGLEFACGDAGFSYTISSIGDYSCNSLFDCGLAGDHAVGNCEFNDEVPAPCTCASLGLPSSGAFFDFTELCVHPSDLSDCYTSGGTDSDRRTCDRQFLNDMRASCADMWSRSQRLQSRQCNQTATIYYFLISRYGKVHFNYDGPV